MVQKTITEQRLLFDSEGLDQGDCLCHDIQQGQSTDLPVIPWTLSLSRHSARPVQDALSCVQGSWFSVLTSLVCGRHMAPPS